MCITSPVCRAVAFMFIFASILMFICMFMFFPGGAAYTELCRYVIDDAGFENSEALEVNCDDACCGVSWHCGYSLFISIVLKRLMSSLTLLILRIRVHVHMYIVCT